MTDFEEKKNHNADGNAEAQSGGESAEKEDEGYKIGYKNPPKHTRFKPGQSGNPKGKPKGTNNLQTDFDEELGEQIIIKESGTARKISKQRVIVKALVAKAAKGDTAAAAKVFEQSNRASGTDAADDCEQDISAEDKAILEDYLARTSKQANETVSSDDDQRSVEPGGSVDGDDQAPAAIDPAEINSGTTVNDEVQHSYEETDTQEEDDDSWLD